MGGGAPALPAQGGGEESLFARRASEPALGQNERAAQDAHCGFVPRKHRLADWFEDEILETYRDRILDFNREAALAWGRINGETNKIGRVRPDLDAQIVATALVNGLTVATRNVEGMDHMGVRVVNPFS